MTPSPDATIGTLTGAGMPVGPIAGSDVIEFANGLPGFEACRAFVLLTADEPGLYCLSTVDGPPASFLVVDPRTVLDGYVCRLSDADRRSLGAGDDDPLLWLALVMMESDGSVAVNLRAPVVINPATMLGRQVIPHHSLYPLRHVLVSAA